jgi:hypothetical protein
VYLEHGSAEQQQPPHHHHQQQRRNSFFSRTTEVIDMSCSGARIVSLGSTRRERDTLWILNYLKCFGDFDLAARKKGMGWERCVFIYQVHDRTHFPGAICLISVLSESFTRLKAAVRTHGFYTVAVRRRCIGDCECYLVFEPLSNLVLLLLSSLVHM